MRSFLILLLTAGVLLCLQSKTHAAPTEENGSALEQKLKAGYLLNFAKFIAWPEESGKGSTDFSLCVYKKNAFGEALIGIEKKQVNGKQIQLHFSEHIPQDIEQCHMLFISGEDKDNLKALLDLLANRPIVTVGDVEGFAEAGGMFEFRIQDGRLSFLINNTKAKQRGLNINSSLLNLAIKVF